MRRRGCVWLYILAFGVICSAAQRGGDSTAPGEQFLGMWAGTWEGSGSGGIELTLDKDVEGTVRGRVSVTGEPTYKAAFKALSFDGNQMNARYDFPPDEAIEIVFSATFEGDTAKGSWSAREKANDNEVAAGTWQVKKRTE